jgi:uncharacterized protein (DUF2147 family)
LHEATIRIMRPMQTLFAAAWLALLAVESAPAEEPVVTGLWQQVDAATGKTEGWFLFIERDGLFEGRIAKMFMEPGDDPNPRCDRCEGDQKKAPFLGLAIVNGMRRHGLEYEDGSILDPRNGTRYRALMHLSPDGQTLVVRGYLASHYWARIRLGSGCPTPPMRSSILRSIHLLRGDHARPLRSEVRLAPRRSARSATRRSGGCLRHFARLAHQDRLEQGGRRERAD